MSGPIALFAPSLRGGGAERAMLDIARGLAHRGVSVDLVLIRAEGPYLARVPPSVRLVNLGARRALTSPRSLLRYLRARRPSVLLATLPEASVIAMLLPNVGLVQLPVITRRAGNFTMEYRGGTFKARLNLLLEKLLLPSASAVVVNSVGAAADLKGRISGLADRIRVIHNPVVWPDHLQQAALPVDHEWFGDAQSPVILSVGRLEQLKDHATLIRAFARVVNSHPSRLVVLGEGSERGGLDRLARQLGVRDQVDLPGFRLNPFAYMSKAGVFVLSSRHEGSPNVLIQAMACGTPVVSTDCPSGPREILQDGKWGELVPVGDADALAAAIIRSLDKPGDSAGLIARANEYDADSSIDAYLALISRVVRGRN